MNLGALLDPANARLVNPQALHRFPWSLTDNAISWLEVTNKCNLACKGCYRDQHSGGHKSLDEIADDLAVFKATRTSDCMSVAGGDPLVHPEIVDIVRMIRKGGWKPIINTNGVALTRSMLSDLKKAGIFGFTFHIDTSQRRPDAAQATEQDLNVLRQRFANMLAAEGGIVCSFNQTVNVKTLAELPEVISWAKKRPGLVHSMVFILYREPNLFGDFDIYANGAKVDFGESYENTGWGGDKTIKAYDVVAQMKRADPLYEPGAYLNGTVDPHSTKWLAGLRIAVGDRTFGYATPRFMEAVQHMSHLFRGRWLSYASPRFLSAGRSALLVFGVFDRGMRRVLARYLGAAAREPSLLFRKVHLQTFMIIQPVDYMPDGQMNMCDGCPDITVHGGKLYWSCRLEEIKRYGTFVTAVPRRQGAGAAILAQPPEPRQVTTGASPMPASGMATDPPR
jgi:hypothetical protein